MNRLMHKDVREELRALKPGWDGYKAPVISEAAIDALGNFVAVPMHDGGVQVEAHFGGKDLEIEIDPNGEIRAVMIAENLRAVEQKGGDAK